MSVIRIDGINDFEKRNGCRYFCMIVTVQSKVFFYISYLFKSIEEGAKEIWLTSEDTGAYGVDQHTTIIALLQRVLEKIPIGSVCSRYSRLFLRK